MIKGWNGTEIYEFSGGTHSTVAQLLGDSHLNVANKMAERTALRVSSVFNIIS